MNFQDGGVKKKTYADKAISYFLFLLRKKESVILCNLLYNPENRKLYTNT